jgi:dTDP-4-amino-4,6-dideoxygalactose transaminase
MNKTVVALGCRPGECPDAERLTRDTLSQLRHAELTDEQVDRVAGAIRAFLAAEDFGSTARR